MLAYKTVCEVITGLSRHGLRAIPDTAGYSRPLFRQTNRRLYTDARTNHQSKRFCFGKRPHSPPIGGGVSAHLGAHVVRDAELQVREDALHAVEGLLPGGAQVLLHGPGHGGEDGLRRLPWVHHLARVLGGRRHLVVVETLDVREGLLHRHHQPGRGNAPPQDGTDGLVRGGGGRSNAQ